MSRHKKVRVLQAIAVCVVVTAGLGQGPVLGQARSRQNLRRPGQLRTIGRSAASYQFQNFSTGLGSLQRSSSARTGVLRSSIGTGQSSFSIQRRAPGGAAGSLNTSTVGRPGARSRQRRLYESSVPGVPDFAARTMRDATRSTPSPSGGLGTGDLASGELARPSAGLGTSAQSDAALTAAWDYLESSEARSDLPGLAAGEPITTLVPAGQEGLYHDYLQEGEEAFREGDYFRAKNKFRLASDIADDNPETMLSLLHASVALSRGAYAGPAGYLRKVLRYFPELPMAAIEPRSFYGNASDYAEHMRRLDAALREDPDNAETNLVSAYYRWFDGDVREAREAALTAREYAAKPEVREAAETFLKGMELTGRLEEGESDETASDAG